jgi:hypothetical protein
MMLIKSLARDDSCEAGENSKAGNQDVETAILRVAYEAAAPSRSPGEKRQVKRAASKAEHQDVPHRFHPSLNREDQD